MDGNAQVQQRGNTSSRASAGFTVGVLTASYGVRPAATMFWFVGDLSPVLTIMTIKA